MVFSGLDFNFWTKVELFYLFESEEFFLRNHYCLRNGDFGQKMKVMTFFRYHLIVGQKKLETLKSSPPQILCKTITDFSS